MSNKEIKKSALEIFMPNKVTFILAQLLIAVVGAVIAVIAGVVAKLIIGVAMPNFVEGLTSAADSGDLSAISSILQIGAGGFIAIVIAAVVFIVISSFSIPVGLGLYNISFKAYKGEEYSAASALDLLKKNPVHIIIVQILVGLAEFVFALIGIIVLAILVAIGAKIGGGISLLIYIIAAIAFIAYCIWISVAFSLAPVILAEDSEKSAGTVISESIGTAKGNVLKIILFALSFIGWIILYGVIYWVVSLTHIGILTGIVSIIFSLLFTPYFTLAFVKFYKNLKGE